MIYRNQIQAFKIYFYFVCTLRDDKIHFATRSATRYFLSAPRAHKNTPRRSINAAPRSVFVCARSGEKTLVSTPSDEIPNNKLFHLYKK